MTDWTRAGLNSNLRIPGVNYGTMDSFVEDIHPNAYMAGLDFKDCFFHWLIHPSSRRWLGLRHPATQQLGVFLYLPFGLGPAPGINDRNVAEITRVVSQSVTEVNVVAFVDDLRLTNHFDLTRTAEEDKELLTSKLKEYKATCQKLGTGLVGLSIPGPC